MLFMGSHFLTTLPKGQSGEIQVKNIWVESQEDGTLRKEELKIRVDSGADQFIDKDPTLGEFVFSSPAINGKWRILSAGGRTIGVTANTYYYMGKAVQKIIGTQEYYPFVCIKL